MLLLGLTACLIALGGASLAVGPVDLTLVDVVSALFGRGPETHQIIVIDIRLPRTILAASIGATLAMAGAALQGFVRNPLASPSLLGTSSAAAFGAVFVLSAGFGGALTPAVPVGAVLMALVSVSILLLVIRGDGRILTLILAGLALSSLFGALTSLTLNLTDNPFGALEIAFWLLGSLADRSFNHVWLSLPFMAASWVLLLLSANSLAALTLGEETAQSLGVNYARTRVLIISATALGTGGAVAVSGTIGFIGLIVPHLIRPLVGHHPDRLLLPSAIAGGLLLLAADCAVRLIPATNELKLGVVTALIGVPFFLWLVFKTRTSEGFPTAA